MPLEPPPCDKHYKDFDSAFRAFQRHARWQGYALVKVRPCNYDSEGIPRRYDFACAYGGSRSHSSTSTGLRKTGTRKTGCPFKMKVVQKRLFNNAWVPDIVCPDHNHGPEDPSKFPEHRVGSLRRRHYEKIKELSEDGKMTARAIRDALRQDDPHLLVNEIDIANLLRELKSMEKDGETGELAAPPSRRRHRHFFNAGDEDEDSSPEPLPDPVPEPSPEESELHKTLLALVPKIVQETIAAMPMAPPPHVAAVAAAATARLRDVAIYQQHTQQQHPGQQQLGQLQQHQPPQPPTPHTPTPHPFQQPRHPPPFYRPVEPAPSRQPPGAGFGILVPTPTVQRQQAPSG
ncbi:hypothetical protein PT974_11405 [Cladobotryum mycophilum]|uniref:FAR1 domain-containing protein n=1 Tax=Cladobotryum mycophilum TaxID=491253 RepID=A0ABR0S547_9HYPO